MTRGPHSTVQWAERSPPVWRVMFFGEPAISRYEIVTGGWDARFAATDLAGGRQQPALSSHGGRSAR